MKRFSHLIKHNKVIRNQRYFMFYDTETKEDESSYRNIGGQDKELKRLSLKLGWACFWDRKRDNEEWFYFDKIQDFWDWVFNLIEEKKIKKLWIYAHNQDFDFKVIDALKHLTLNNWECSFWTAENFNFMLIFEHGNEKEKKRIYFLDTMNYARISLEDLGEHLGLAKGKVDFKDVSDEELKTYCRRDVEIIYKFIKEFISFLKINNLGSLKYTIAGTAYKCYTHKFMPKTKKSNINVHTHKKGIDLERDSYKGGRTECFYLGEVKNYVYDLDVNSMYPYQMENFRVPVKLISYEERERTGENFKAFYLNAKKEGFLVIAELEFYLPLGCNNIGIKEKINKIDTLVFPIGRIKSSVCSPEIDYILKHGDIIKSYKINLYMGSNIFKEFVTYFFEKKNRYKEEGNLAYTLMCKLILNSLYGKFGQKNPIQIFKKFEDGKKDIMFCKEIDDLVDERHIHTSMYRIGNIGWYGTGEFEEGFNSMVAIPSFISAYARIYLGSLMDIAGKNNFYYCDTDSIFVNQEGYERIKDKGFMGSEIGHLKVEDEGYLEIKGSKDYIFNGERKIKGIKKNAKEIETGIYEQEKFIRIKTALKYGLTKDQYIYIETKQLSRAYTKGIVSKNGEIKPYVF